MTLRSRIALLVGITVLLASAIGGIGTAITSGNVGRDRVDRALAADAETFREESPRLVAQLQFAFDTRRALCDADTADTAGTADTSDRATRIGTNRLRYLPEFPSSLQLVRPNGNIFAACTALPVSELDTGIAARGTGSAYQTVTLDGESFRVLTRGFGDVGAVQFARSLAITQDTQRALLVRSTVFGVLGAACASALGWLFARRATEPLARLSATAERVARTQDLAERIDVDGDDEIAALAASFNTMLASLATSREQQKRLVQDAGHELRTPLTSVRTNIELLQRYGDVDPATRTRMLADIAAELGELTDLSNELIDSATEVPTSIELRDDIDLVAIVEACAARAERRTGRAIVVAPTGETRPPLRGDSGLLGRAVSNLIGNAIKFSDRDTEIRVEVGACSVLVCDRGPGIPDADLPFVFDRFFRSTASRSAPGSGLGLAIVQQIVVAHGGTVHAANRVDGGAQVGFALPAVTTAEAD